MAVGKSRALKILVEQLSKFQTNTKMAVAKSRPFTVLVEGNIGCGKTTFLQHFAKVGSGAGGWELDRQKTQECRIANVGL